MGSIPSRGGKGCIVYWDKKLVSWLSFSSPLHFFVFFVTYVFFSFFLYSFIFSFFLHFFLSLSSNILIVSRTWTQCLAALLCSHVLTILKNAAHAIMPKSLLCKYFFSSPSRGGKGCIMCSEINLGFRCRSSFYACSLRSFNIAHLNHSKAKIVA